MLRMDGDSEGEIEWISCCIVSSSIDVSSIALGSGERRGSG